MGHSGLRSYAIATPATKQCAARGEEIDVGGGGVPRRLMFVSMCLVLLAAIVKIGSLQPSLAAQQISREPLIVAPNEIGGVVTGQNGPEAGVWVIAESSDFPTMYRKIVITDNNGQFLVPDVPKASYEVWARGYGLVDSARIKAVPGATLVLNVVNAPDAQSAAQIYPANYWFSLIHVPRETEFRSGLAPAEPRLAPGPPADLLSGIHDQSEWIYAIRECQQCHQLGDKATREIEPSLGRFNSTLEAWDRRTMSGQRAYLMAMALNQFPRERALVTLAGWTDRIAAGELPPAPPRPQGLERNVVLTEWNWASSSIGQWVHDEIATDKRAPTLNSHRLVYGSEMGGGTLAIVDPSTNSASEVKVPARDDPKSIEPYLMSEEVAEPSPYFGDKTIWTDHTSPHNVMMDRAGRLWVTSAVRGRSNPSYCKEGSSNPYAKNYPINVSQRQLSSYDPQTKKWRLIDTCFGTQHLQFGFDKDNTLYFSGQEGAVGWVNTEVFEKTGDEQLAQGWCPAYVDTKGHGKFDWRVDKTVEGFPYGIAVNPVDGSVWYAAVGLPGKIVRIDRGSNPPATCRTEVYEPPYAHGKRPGKEAFLPHGIDVDRNGLIWVSLAGSGHLASFDRRKCSVRSAPNATGQQCPEAWKLYQLPGPLLSGTNLGSADYVYYNWVDQFNTLGMGENIPIATGTNSDSLLILDYHTGKWVILRVPYPLGFFARGLDGRIDDPKAGWKGRGLWSNFSPTVPWHIEGGKMATPILVHFQIRPNPLAH